MSDINTQAKVEMYNDAMDELGESPIDAFDGGQPAAQDAARRFHSVSRKYLSLHRWTFQKIRVPLSRKAAPPNFQYTYAFDVPNGATVHELYCSPDTDRPERAFRREGLMIVSNAEQLWAVTDGGGDAANWPAYFKALVSKGIAAASCMQITGNRSWRDELMTEAEGIVSERPYGGLFRAAREADSAQDNGGPPMELGAGPLVEARR